MTRIRPANEDEMVLLFLSMELRSPRYNKQIEHILQLRQADRRLLTEGDITDKNENALRRVILGDFRGYGRDAELFSHFPASVRWEWTLFDEEDLPRIRYINYSYWNELSDFTGSPLAAAKTIRAGRTIFHVPNDGFWAAAIDLRDGKTFPPLIMLTGTDTLTETNTPAEVNAMTGTDTRTVIVLEGHKRITAYALEPAYFHRVSVLLGYCEDEALKNWYGGTLCAPVAISVQPFLLPTNAPR